MKPREREREKGGTLRTLNSPLGFERTAPKDFLIAFDSPLFWSEGGDQNERERKRERGEKR